MDIVTDKNMLFCKPVDKKVDIFHGLVEWCGQFLDTNKHFIDIGAHLGGYSLLLSDKCKTVHTFESDPVLYECINVSMSLNNKFNIKTYDTILDKKVDILFNDGEIVRTNTLDHFNIKDVSFIKIESNGKEFDIIQGAKNTIADSNYPPIMFTTAELVDKKTFFAYLEESGYTLHPVSGTNGFYLASDHKKKEPTDEKKVPEKKVTSNHVETLVAAYENKSLQSDNWEDWYEIGTYYRNQRKHADAYDCITKAFNGCPAEKLPLLHHELSIVCYYVGKIQEGYDSCEYILFSNAPWNHKNNTLNNMGFYMSKVPFTKVVPMNYDLPTGYIASSSSIIKNVEGYILNLRSVNYSINNNGGYMIRDNNNIVRTRNFILNLDKDLMIVDGTEIMDHSGIKTYPKNILGIEDIRLINDKEFFCTYLEVNEQRTPQMCYCHYDTQHGVTKVVPMMVGDKLQCEKNWIPFEVDNDLCFIYSYQPFKLYKVDRDTGVCTLWKEVPTKFEGFRGSSNLLKYKGGYITTIHQVYYNSPRKYFHRFMYMDEAFTTFSYSKIFFFESPNIEYTVSICHSEQGLLIPYSVRDNCSKIGILSYAELDTLLNL
jgi:tetratricopeptide (TPR) repeat protein